MSLEHLGSNPLTVLNGNQVPAASSLVVQVSFFSSYAKVVSSSTNHCLRVAV